MSGPQGNMSSLAKEEIDPRNCYHDEMVKLVENGGAIIIEVRRPDEIAATGMMNRACHIPLDELKEALSLPDDELKEKYGVDKPNPDGSNVVFTCRSGRRSLIALETAKEFGYTKARHYSGGWNSWVEKNKL
ncbi:rhodanese domain-containing protein CG4456-like [Lytechinus variegatus]|uniref:rhodanese domain-containing protein CG4456-like n=1 Tax=Lytechinus variegatus TaxID=7654 RepID=UPI001BB1E5A7|nr:rhodanese domain-containing protein CG4456-like [Lytechinus variegatus]XP_041483591.1 rhodanese domain-containing protein CG4456-like [Lytechinus variegatus]